MGVVALELQLWMAGVYMTHHTICGNSKSPASGFYFQPQYVRKNVRSNCPIQHVWVRPNIKLGLVQECMSEYMSEYLSRVGQSKCQNMNYYMWEDLPEDISEDMSVIVSVDLDIICFNIDVRINARTISNIYLYQNWIRINFRMYVCVSASLSWGSGSQEGK